ncbi:MAG: hypothetical protein IT377_31495 [Polyangiaceae bacterium]|nr:hypothetical protein [Polyangiaceae bacterium]
MHYRVFVVPVFVAVAGCGSESDGGGEGGSPLLSGSVQVGYYGATHAPTYGVVNRGTILGGASDPEMTIRLSTAAIDCATEFSGAKRPDGVFVSLTAPDRLPATHDQAWFDVLEKHGTDVKSNGGQAPLTITEVTDASVTGNVDLSTTPPDSPAGTITVKGAFTVERCF